MQQSGKPDSPKTGGFDFHQQNASSMQEADPRDTYKYSSKSGCISTTAVTPDTFFA